MSIKYTSGSKDVISALEKCKLKGIVASCELVLSQAKALVSVDKGQLRDTMFYNADENQGQVGSPLDYGVYQEYGTGEFAEEGKGRTGGWYYQDENGDWVFTKGQRPKPYLRPAFRENVKNIQEIIGQTIREGVGK